MAAFDSPVSMAPQAFPPNVGADPKNFQPRMAAAFAGQTLVERPVVEPFDDDQALLKVFKDAHKLCFENRWVYERNWWRNLLYVLGRQWIFYNVQRGAWQDKRMQKWIPRPVTNKMSETVDAMRSVFQSVDLEVSCQPSSDDSVSILTAEAADRIHPAVKYEHGMSLKMFEADFWNIATGNVFIHPWWDARSEHGTLLVPFEVCESCGQVSPPDLIVKAGQMCPACGQSAFKLAFDENGKQIGKEYPVGRGATDIVSPFELGVPPGYTSFGSVPLVIRQRWRTKEWYETNAPELAKTLNWSKNTNERSLQMIRSLASQSDVQGTTLGAQSSEPTGGDGLTEYELWMKPTPVWPNGLLLRVAGEQGRERVIRMEGQQLPGPLPTRTLQGQPLFPWIHMAYNRFGGRLWGRSPLDVLVQKQDQINQLDSLTLMGVQRMSNPVWIEPKGSEVKKFTGEPGLVIRYNALVGGGNAKPERIEGTNIPSSVLKLREIYMSDFESLAGTQDVLKGAKPAGIEAFSALQLLVERSQSRFAPVLAERGEAYRQWYQLALELERQYGPAERVWSVMGPNRRWIFETFQNANLQGTVKILMEDGSQAPKTNLGKRAAITQLNQLQLLDPNDPDQRYGIYRAFGTTDLLPMLNANVQNALAEQAEFEEWASSKGSMVIGQGMAVMPGIQPAPSAQQVPPSRAYFDEEQPPAAPPPQAQPGQPGEMPQEPGAQDPMAMGTGMMLPQTLIPCPLVRKIWQDDNVHMAEHRKWGNSEGARRLFKQRPELETFFVMHLMEHEAALQQIMAQQMAMQAGPPQGAPSQKGAAGQGQAMNNSNRESGKPGTNQAGPA